MKKLLTLKNFIATGEDDKIVSCASFEQLENEKVCIYGPGGSGKSILLKFIYGLRLPDVQYHTEDFKLNANSISYHNFNEQRHPQITDLNKHSDLLLIDEPENKYDIEGFKAALESMDHYKGLIFVSHNLDFVRYFADKVIVIHYGAFKGTYKTDDFFNNADPFISYISRMGC